MEKTQWQISAEKNTGIARKYKLKIVNDDPKTGHKAGEIVTAVKWGTFGCWDEQNRWVDFYNTVQA